MTSWVKISGSALLFVVLIGLGYGAPPLDVSDFFGTPAEAAPTPPTPEAKSRMDTSSDLSELLAKLGGGKNNALRALATMLNPSHSHVDEKPDDDVDELLSYFGGLDLDKEPEDIITDATVNCRKHSDHKSGCEEDKQCHWLQSGKFDGKCIHQTERLYNALYKKLNKRGKKDLAIQVFYNSRPAKIKLPHGLYGPQITSAFNYIKGFQPSYAPIGYNSYLNTYGFGGYNRHGYGQAYGIGHRGYGYGGYGFGKGGYGHGYGGYGYGKGSYGHGYGGYGYGKGGYGYNNGGYGYGNGGYGHDNGGYGHDNGGYGYDNGEVRNNGTSDDDNGDSGHGNGGYGHDDGGYGHGNGGYGYDNGGYGNGGYGHGNGGYGHGSGGYGPVNGGYGHDNGGYGHDNGGYGYGNGGYGHGHGGYGGHSHTEYSGPSYGYQGHSTGYSAGPSHGYKGYGGWD